LPDPVHTHFSLLFDRLSEALQQGAQDQGYNYDGSWLPWSDEARQYGSLNDQQRADALQESQENQPGVLVFRKALPPYFARTQRGTRDTTAPVDSATAPAKPGDTQQAADKIVSRPYNEGLIIFVVGENPTGGIDAEQFDNALQWMSVLGVEDPNPRLRILGPYFSGSIPSLAKALVSNGFINVSDTSATSAGAPEAGTDSGKSESAAKSIAIFSGSVSSRTSIAWFTDFLGTTPGRFYSFQENDDAMIDRYCRYLKHLHYDTGKLAIISEDETAYGVLPPNQRPGGLGEGQRQPSSNEFSKWLPNCDYPETSQENPAVKDVHGPLYLYYPRDIASLRSAYEQQPSGSGGSPQSQPGGSATGLPIDLTEPSSRQRDTIRSYGGKQTILSQEAALFGITNLLRSHDIEFIILRSSNTLDQVFLTRFLARAYPSARVVLTSADLLFRRSGETAGFRGTMTLTTYPLLTWQQDWTYWQTPESRHSHRAFPEDFAEGLYLATRFLIEANDQELLRDAISDAKNALSLGTESSVVVQNYAPPAWLLSKQPEATRPPTWLSVVGSGQLWPVAVLDDKTLTGSNGQRNSPDASPVNSSMPEPPGSTLPYAATGVKPHPAQFLLPYSMFVCCVLILSWACWHFFCCLFGSHNSSIKLGEWSLSASSFRCLAYFARVPRRQHKWLIFIGCTILGLMAILIAMMTGVLSSDPPLEHGWQVKLYCAVLFILTWMALISNYRTYMPPKLTRAPVLWGEDPPEEKEETAQKEAQSDPRRIDIALITTGGLLFLAVGLALLLILRWLLVTPLTEANRVFAIWRSINLFTGVSPMVPLLLLALGLYGWFWYSLSGLALFNAGRPKLPRLADLPPHMPMFSRPKAGSLIERSAIPLNGNYRWHFVLILVPCLALWYLSGDVTAVRNLGQRTFGRVYFFWAGLLVVLTLTEAWQMLQTWGHLRQLLVYLDRLPLRRTLQALKGYSWGTVWKMSGNVMERRDQLISRQIESLRHLENEVNRYRQAHPKTAAETFDGKVDAKISLTEVKPLGDQIKACNDARDEFRDWFTNAYNYCWPGFTRSPKYPAGNLYPVLNFQKQLAATAGVVLKRILLPQWRRETRSQIMEFSIEKGEAPAGDVHQGSTNDTHPLVALEPLIRAAEEFFCLPYLGFIQNILGRIRTMTLSMTVLYVTAALSVASYPFDPRPVLGGTFLAVFLVTAVVTIFVYAEMHRDATLSQITNTSPGKLGSDFWVKLVTFGFGPLVALLTALFPQIAGFVTSWLQPAVGAIK
jgi:hypothetical protein